MTIEFDENKYEFIKCEAGEEQRASFWFKPKDLDLTPENKFLVVLNFEKDDDGDGDIEWGDFHAICVGEETYFPDEIDEELLDVIYDNALENAPEEL